MGTFMPKYAVSTEDSLVCFCQTSILVETLSMRALPNLGADAGSGPALKNSKMLSREKVLETAKFIRAQPVS